MRSQSRSPTKSAGEAEDFYTSLLAETTTDKVHSHKKKPESPPNDRKIEIKSL